MKRIILLLTIISFASCNDKADCKTIKDEREKETCSMIVDVSPKAGSVYFNTIGRNIENNEPCKCDEESRWWATFSDQIEKGDTIIKRKGELVFSIHKKDTVLNFNWECNGKIYK